MKTTTKIALSLAAVLAMSEGAFADEVVRLGFAGAQGGSVSFIKPTPQTTTAAVYQNGDGVGAPNKKHRKFVERPGYGENSSVSYYKNSR